jgi:hypothetical protein
MPWDFAYLICFAGAFTTLGMQQSLVISKTAPSEPQTFTAPVLVYN